MSDFFKPAPASEQYFKEHGQAVHYRKNQTFVRPENADDWVYFLADGLVEISYSSHEGHGRLLGYFFPNAIFAQSGSFFGNKGSELEYTTVAETTIYRIKRSEFFELISTNLQCSQEYVGFLLRSQFLLIERVAYMGESSIERMVIRLLCGLARYYGHLESTAHVIDAPITQDTIARLTHATRESASKTLRKLLRQKIISIEKRRLTIIDIQALESLLQQ